MSDIEYTTIDAEYPVAGVDNDTQGFRDNFAAISTGLQVAKTEITDLEKRTVKLVDSTNNPASNNFNESTIKNCIGFIYDLHPCFRRNTICELYDEVMSE